MIYIQIVLRICIHKKKNTMYKEKHSQKYYIYLLLYSKCTRAVTSMNFCQEKRDRELRRTLARDRKSRTSADRSRVLEYLLNISSISPCLHLMTGGAGGPRTGGGGARNEDTHTHTYAHTHTLTRTHTHTQRSCGQSGRHQRGWMRRQGGARQERKVGRVHGRGRGRGG